MADLRLADAVDAAEALLDAVGVPGQVVVDHEVGALQVYALAGGVRGHQHAHGAVLLELLLRAVAVVAGHAALDGEHRVLSAQQLADLGCQVLQRVLVLREDDELLAPAVVREHVAVVLQQAGELVPLAVLAALAHLVGLALQQAQLGDLHLQLPCRGGCGRGVDDVVLQVLQLLRGVVVLVEVLVQAAEGGCVAGRAVGLVVHLQQAVLKALAPAAERLVDGLRRGGQAPLQDGEGEADAVLALAVQPVGAVELVGDVAGNQLVQLRLRRRERVLHRVGAALREEGAPVEAEKLLLDQAAHDVGEVAVDSARRECLGVCGAVSLHVARALEAVPVHQRHEQLEVPRLAVVRRGRHEQQVLRDVP